MKENLLKLQNIPLPKTEIVYSRAEVEEKARKKVENRYGLIVHVFIYLIVNIKIVYIDDLS